MFLEVLTDRTYRHLFAAQATSLIGTGMMTVALGLLAYNLAGDRATAVLGTALAIKMVAYVLVAPVATAWTARWARKPFLVSMDLVRAALVLCLPFVTAIWQIYVLTALVQICSAAFSPTFQATIPDVLTDEAQYTRALSLSRLAYDLENLLSPLLAALLLGVISFRGLFGFTLAGFVSSAILVMTVPIPRRRNAAGPRAPVLQGMRRYLATPRLRGMLALSFAEAAAGSLVIVNTVIYAHRWLGGNDRTVAFSMAIFGGASMIAALSLPRLLNRLADRHVMQGGAFVAAAGLVVLVAGAASIPSSAREAVLWMSWALIGAGYAAILTPGGRLLRRSADAEGRPALFAAQFSLSHGCWLVMYPIAGWLGTLGGPLLGGAVMLGVVLASVALSALLWPAADPDVVAHSHDDLPSDHPHLAQGEQVGDRKHAHPFVVDDLHPTWPNI
ncbi:MFS transporter [Luteibacter aegosomatissinici]|uniref:MFS transporter n=1 Tax=Luteibacter aegosomatissinici TaxID=2911539 RepID=UPI001FFA3817|nr:MFS transporter [Luteibacter aegosomatissinici]UPG94303.1 MFS transporter [Luteibacter aegosomatissinici]